MIVYHGSTIEIVSPDNQHSLRHLDFGQGFYVTPVLIQAERWAKRKADLISQNYAIINEYEMLDNWQNFIVKIFNDPFQPPPSLGGFLVGFRARR